MAYTPKNNPYIPGDPYSYDLKWIVARLIECLNAYKAQRVELDDLREYVTTYFDSLDVDQAISDKLDQMLADGELEALYWPTGVINVKKYGATGDGSTDDTEAINAAIAVLNLHGGVLYFPQGTYNISSTLRIRHNCTCVRGDTQQGTYIRQTADAVALHFGEPNVVLPSFRTEDIGIIYAGPGAPSVGTYGLLYDHGVNCTVDNVVIGGFYTGIRFIQTGNSFISETGVVSSVNNAIGIYLGSRSVSVAVTNSYVGFSGDAANTGIGLYDADGDIADLRVNYLDIGNGHTAVLIDGQDSPADFPPADIRLFDVVADGCRSAGILIRNINSRGNVSIHGGWINPLPNGSAICINVLRADHVTISGVTLQQLRIDSPSVFGVNLDSCNDVQIEGCQLINVFSPVSAADSSRVTISGNSVKLAAGVSSASLAVNMSSCSVLNINGNSIAGDYAGGVIISGGNHSIVASNMLDVGTNAYTNDQANVVEANNMIM